MHLKKISDEEILKLDLPTKKANRAEIDSFNYLCACITDLEEGEKTLRKRLDLIPGGWRDYRMIHSKLEFLLKLVGRTFDEDKQRTIMRTAKYARHKIVYAPEVKREKDLFIIDSDQMTALVMASIGECKLRMCEPNACRSCQLGKALDAYSLISRGNDRAWWEVMAALMNGTGEGAKE